MNAFIAKAFVVLNEILAILTILVVFGAGYYVFKQYENIGMAIGAVVGGLLFVIYFYGMFAVMIENHKLLKEIAKK